MNGDRSKREMTNNPGKEDIQSSPSGEGQRTPEQPREGVVPDKDKGKDKDKAAPRPPTQTQTDTDRADWEGMGQPQSKPGS
jgi:hypothetical protein